MVDTLEHDLGAVSSVLLCTAAGVPLAADGLPDAEVRRAARLTGGMFAAGRELGGRGEGLQTIQLSSGEQHTVIAAVPVPGQETLVLSATAEGVGLGVLLVRTRQVVDDLREVLSAAAE
ncbi:hypothetical protein [Nocardioides xinjiangensis]|uniref:hypothetical protein n=1 Tax=Nocardioides xinjiangensis TaxID=2817376 RepID=UPI001B3092F4|nr:hypothetical protein [Nocardioides sp. SYSU D00778]